MIIFYFSFLFSIEFTLDGVHILTGGGEGVIVKWDVKSMRKLSLVPRLGTTITNIFLSYEKILACTSNNNIKIFTSNLEDEGGITGFSKYAKTNKMIWHQDSSCLVLIGPTQHYLQFFDPLESGTEMSPLSPMGLVGSKDPRPSFSGLTMAAKSKRTRPN